MDEIQHLLKKLTLKEKCLLLTGKNFWETETFEKLNLPNLVLNDGPFGVRKVSGKAEAFENSVPATCFPSSVALASSWNDRLVNSVGKALGEECRDQGVDVLLGPGMNIKRNPLCGRNFEYFSEDPYLTGKIASSYIRGLQSTGVHACVKHFLANNQEDLRYTVNAIIDERALREIYARGFEIAIKESEPSLVMCSYNRINGLHVSRNEEILKTLLRDKLGFKGLIVSDWGAVVNLGDSIKAGLNLEMPGGYQNTKELIKRVENNTLTEEEIDEAITPLLKLMTLKRDTQKKINCDYEKNHKLAVTAVEESAVLLKNEDNILPLEKKTNLAILGPFARNPRIQGAGSSKVNPTKVVSFLDVLEQNYITYTYSEGYSFENENLEEELLNEAKRKAEKAEVVIMFLGLPESSEAEGFDRNDILMPNNQTLFIEEISKVNPNIVVVLTAGSPVNMQWYPFAKAILHTHLSGQGVGEGTYNLLFGKANPSGKLTESYPYYESDCPSSNYFGRKRVNVEYRESIFVGYRYYELAKKHLQFPFGFGLSYTKFSYRDLAIDKDKISKDEKVKVTISVKNYGKYPGKEVVQLYVGQRFPILFKPIKELKRYQKIYLKPNETKEVTFTLSKDDFKYYDIDLGRFAVEDGTYNIYVGPCSDDVQSRMITVVSDDPKPDKNYQKFAKSYYNLESFERLYIPFREFEDIYGRDITHVYPSMKRPFTQENTLSDTKAYWSGRFIINKIKEIAKDLAQGEDENEEMILNSFLDVPFRSYVQLTSGEVTPRQVKGIINFCNGRLLSGALKIKPKKSKAKK